MTDRPATASPGLPAAVDRAMGGVATALSAIASTTIAFTMLLITADVVLRAAFDVPINGVSDFVAYSIVACVFVQLGSAIRGDRLIAAEFLMAGWKARRPLLAEGAEALFYAVAAAILARALAWLWDDFAKAWATGEFTGAIGAYTITLWPFKLAVAIGVGFAALEAARRSALAARAALAGLRGGRPALAEGLAGLVALVVFLVAFTLVMTSGALSPAGIGAMAFAGLFVLVACGMPVAFAVLAMSFLGIWMARGNITVAGNALGIAASGAIRSFEFGVVPLFVMMGLVLDRANVGRDAFDVAVRLLRRVSGGLGIATVAANAVFAAITGSSIASAAVFSRIAVPPMTEAGHSRRFAVGVVAGSSVLGMLIPPSLLLIIYGLLAETSIGDLFIAAIVPGLLLALVFAVLIWGLCTFLPGFTGVPKPVAADEMGAGTMVLRLLPVAFIVALVMGGIYGGLFSPTEAGAIGAFGAFLVALARRRLDWATLREVVLETGYITAGILLLIIAANLYARMLTLSTIPMQTTAMIGDLDLTLIGFMFAYFALVVLLGMILDSVSIMLIILPIALPIVTHLGGDLVWFGIVTVIAIEIGLLTPPFGLSVFVVKGSLPEGFATLGDIFRGSAPFVIAMALFVALMILFPAIVVLPS